MPLDVCIEVMRTPVSSPNPQRQYELGDIIAAYPAIDCGVWNGSEYIPHNLRSHHAYVFLTGVPINDIGEFELQNKTEWDDINAGTVHRRKAFGVETAKLPPGQLNKFLNTGYDTFTWEQAKAVIDRKFTGVSVTDADLGADP